MDHDSCLTVRGSIKRFACHVLVLAYTNISVIKLVNFHWKLCFKLKLTEVGLVGKNLMISVVN